MFAGGYALAGVIDLRHGRIPNAVTYPLALLALVARPGGVSPIPAVNLLGAIAAGAILGALAWRGWMGLGDAKLAVVIALAAGPLGAAVAFWLGTLSGGVVALVLLAAHRIRRSERIAFGPFLAAGAVLVTLAG